jgi:hypothetical protein
MARGGHPEELALMGSRGLPTRHHLVPFGYLILDGVGELVFACGTVCPVLPIRLAQTAREGGSFAVQLYLR